jgi:hypothetical protein
MKKIRDALAVTVFIFGLASLWFWLTQGNPWAHFQESLLVATFIGLCSVLGGTVTKWY